MPQKTKSNNTQLTHPPPPPPQAKHQRRTLNPPRAWEKMWGTQAVVASMNVELPGLHMS
eukprot:m.4513 g.4513  ORF g.4513 m.4513 type:complete len:59 (+) comp2240_c0_seq1:196-372(+)